MVKYIFLDTNNWIYLSNGFNILSNKHDELHFKIFDFIKRYTANNTLVFLVNQIVIDEWDRNILQANKQVNELENRLKNLNKSLELVNTIIGESEEKKIEVLKNKLSKEIASRIKKHKIHIKEVEDFLKNKAARIDISGEVKIQAADLALLKKAPFIGPKKNSMADAIILLSSIEHIKNNIASKFEIPGKKEGEVEYDYNFPESYFVSSNKGDFSDPKDSSKIHIDLEPIIKLTETKFHFSLFQLVRLIEKELLSEEEEVRLAREIGNNECKECDKSFNVFDVTKPFLIPDENKTFEDEDQLEFSFSDAAYVKKKIKQSDFETEIRIADCEDCRSKHIVCNCGEFNVIAEYDQIFECEGYCGKYYVVYCDKESGEIEYEIKKQPKECLMCGSTDREVNDSEICSECEEMYLL